MNDLDRILWSLMEEATAARAHFHTWWALRNLALPEYLETMNNHEYVDFFHVSNSGHYKLFFVALSKIYDRDSRASGVSKLKDELEQAGWSVVAREVGSRLAAVLPLVRKVLGIRNKTIGHNETGIPRERVYKINAVTPDEIRQVIDVTCATINYVAEEVGLSNRISGPERYEKAVLNMLEVLERRQT